MLTNLIIESFIHAGTVNDCKVNLSLIHSEKLAESNIHEKLKDLHGILVAPGFGGRGIEGKIAAVRYARENKIPFLGICLGMQCAVIEFARNVLNLKDAHTTEINAETTNPVIAFMEEQKKQVNMGGTMRLGTYPCTLQKDSLAFNIYGKQNIQERHRHRYEFNNSYLDKFQQAGMTATGINPETGLVEIIEIKDHPMFIGVQYHPEYKSTVANPHPLFIQLVKAAIEHNKQNQ